MNKLRLAFVLDDPAAPPMAARRALDALIGDPCFSIECLIEGRTGRRGSLSPYRLVNVIDRRLFARSRDVDTPHYDAIRQDLPVRSPEAFVGEGREVDVIADFTEDGAPATLRDRAHFGLWRLTSCDAYAGFADVLSSPTADVALIRFENSQTPPRRVATAAYNIKISVARTAAFIREKSARLLVRELRRLVMERAPQDAGPFQGTQAASPGWIETAAYAAGFTGALAARGAEKLREKAGSRPGMFYLKYGTGDPLNFDPARAADILPEGNHYWADPFLFDHDGEQFIFFEDYDYRSGCGRICAGKLEKGGFSLIGPVLETDYHLSYPYLFRHEGAIYMLPETNETKRLEIWRCDKFPEQWTLCATALEGESAADSVIASHDGAWWLFTNLGKDSFDDHCSELFLFRADGPMLQTLQPHPLNPVVIDSRTARGGGRVFEKDGRLFRISQDNSNGSYGYALNVMEITRIDMLGYSERLARKITPDFDDGLIGCHHGDFRGGNFVIDARRAAGGRP